MRLRLPLLLASVVLTACLDTLDTPDGRFGTVSAAALENGGGYIMKPEAAFYGKTDLQYQPFTNDTCLVLPYSPSTTVNGNLITLDAGENVFTSIGGRTDTLQPIPGIIIRVYSPKNPTGIPFTPGDTLTITVPGGRGFPASAVSVRTAEPFDHGAIGVPAADADLPLTWNAATQPGSQMTFSLRYANAVATQGQNEQVFCSFIDDGAATIPAAYLTGWRTALNDNRSTRVVRIRSRQVDVDSRTRLALISSFARPLNPANTPQ